MVRHLSAAVFALGHFRTTKFNPAVTFEYFCNGLILGGITVCFHGRIHASVIAHAIHNTVVFTEIARS